MKRTLKIVDKNGDVYDIFNLPKGKPLDFETIDLSGMDLTELPDLSSVTVDYFNCSDNKLKNLKGSPQKVNGDFRCNKNELTSFESTTEQIGNCFYCHDNPAPSLDGMPQKVHSICCGSKHLKKLKGAPLKINGFLRCSYSSITDLEGCSQEIGGNLELSNNDCLENLKGGPKVVNHSVMISNCENLTSFDGGPKKVGSPAIFKEKGEYGAQFYCSNCGLKKLKGAPKIVYGTFYVGGVHQKINSLNDSPKVVYGAFRIEQDEA